MKDFDLFINGNSIERVISDELDVTTDKLSDVSPVDLWKSNAKQAGTISWEVDTVNVEKLLTKLNYEFEEQKNLALQLNNEMNEYLESKINKYLENNNLDLLDWSRHGNCKWWKNKREYFYDDVFITGVEVISPLYPVEDVDNLKTEYKCEIKYY